MPPLVASPYPFEQLSTISRAMGMNNKAQSGQIPECYLPLG